MPSVSLSRIAWASVPVTLVSTLGWFGIFTFVNAYLVKELGYSNEQWTRATLWLSGSMVVVPFVSVWLASHVGRRLTLALAMAACAVTYAGFATTRNPVVIAALFVLVASVQSTVSAVWPAMVAEAGGSLPGRALAVFYSVMTAVGVLTLAGGGRLLSGMGYRPGFVICAVTSGVCVIAFLWLSRDLGVAGQAKAIALRHLSRRDLSTLVGGPFLAVMIFGVCFEPFNYHTSNQLYPNLARDLFGMTETEISSVVALGRIPALLTLFVLARVIDRVNPIRCYGLGVALVGCCVVLMGQAPGPGIAIAAYMAYYLFYGGIWGSGSAAVNAAVSPRLRDVSFAVMISCSTAAVFLAGIVHNRMLAAGWSLRALFTWCGIIALCGGLVLALGSFRSRAEAPG